MKRAYRFAKNHRAIGVGVLGYHSLLQSKLIEFESLETKQLNYQIFKTLKERTEQASQSLFNTHGYTCSREGFANTTLIAIAPTKSSSFILGQVSMGIEPIKSNYFIKDLAKSKTIYKNPFLIAELEKYELNTPDVWEGILKRDGSVQHLDFPTKEVFKSLNFLPLILVFRLSVTRFFISFEGPLPGLWLFLCRDLTLELFSICLHSPYILNLDCNQVLIFFSSFVHQTVARPSAVSHLLLQSSAPCLYYDQGD
jgi:hypothetical protein